MRAACAGGAKARFGIDQVGQSLMPHCRRAAVSSQAVPGTVMGRWMLVSWQLIVENESTGVLASRPQGDVILTGPHQDGDRRPQPQSLDGQRPVGCCPQVEARVGGDSASRQGRFWPYRCFLERRAEPSSKEPLIEREEGDRLFIELYFNLFSPPKVASFMETTSAPGTSRLVEMSAPSPSRQGRLQHDTSVL